MEPAVPHSASEGMVICLPGALQVHFFSSLCARRIWWIWCLDPTQRMSHTRQAVRPRPGRGEPGCGEMKSRGHQGPTGHGPAFEVGHTTRSSGAGSDPQGTRRSSLNDQHSRQAPSVPVCLPATALPHLRCCETAHLPTMFTSQLTFHCHFRLLANLEDERDLAMACQQLQTRIGRVTSSCASSLLGLRDY